MTQLSNPTYPRAYVASATALTDSELVAAVAATRIRVKALIVLSDTAGTVTLESGGTTDLIEGYPAAGGGYDLSGCLAHEKAFLCETALGESLTVSTNITGNHTVTVIYERAS